MISLITFFIILGILITVHEFGHFITAKRLGVKVEIFSFGFGKRLLTKKKNDTEYSLSLIPLGGYVKLAGFDLQEYKGNPNEYLSKPVSQRAQIMFFGPLLNYILGFLCFWLVFLFGYPALTTKVGSLIDGFGAKDAGIEVGDKITSVDGKEVDTWEDLQRIVQSKKSGTKILLSVLRNNKKYNIEVKIKEKQLDDAIGAKRNVGLIGITPEDEIINVRHGPLESFILGMDKTWKLTLLTYKALWQMVTGKLSMQESVTGPLGIFYITSKVTNLGIIAVLHLMAVLSVNLCIFNLLPLPVLDGGHIVRLSLEKIRGKPLGHKAERIITQIGFTFIISLAIFTTYNDLVRFFGEKISKFFGQ